MYVHVFGGTSSLGCCNYTLGKTAVVNASHVKADVAERLKNIYIQPLSLMNLKTEQSNSYKMLGKSVKMVVST